MTTTAPSAPLRITDVPEMEPPQLVVPVDERSAGGLPQVRLPSGHLAVHAVRYRDVKAVLTNPAFVRRGMNEVGSPNVLPTVTPPELLLNLDPPDHRRLRGVVNAEYGAASLSALVPRIREALDVRCAALRESRAPDLMRDVLEPLTVEVNCSLLGLPAEDVSEIREAGKTVQLAPDDDVPGLYREFQSVYGYLADVVAGRKELAHEGVVSRLQQARWSATPPLSDAELVGLLFGALLGGDQNVLTVLSKSTYLALHSRPLWTSLADPERVGEVTEEFFRLVSLGTASAFPRMASQDVDLSAGRVHAGDVVYPDTRLANRDSAVFEDPEAVIPGRGGPRHLQFGYGMHHCMGSALSTVEITTVLSGLAREFPDLALEGSAAAQDWDEGVVLRRPRTIPVTGVPSAER